MRFSYCRAMAKAGSTSARVSLIFGDPIERSESSAFPGHMALMMRGNLGAQIPRFHKFEVLEQLAAPGGARSGYCRSSPGHIRG
jgi:hypothetical protein